MDNTVEILELPPNPNIIYIAYFSRYENTYGIFEYTLKHFIEDYNMKKNPLTEILKDARTSLHTTYGSASEVIGRKNRTLLYENLSEPKLFEEKE